MQDFELSTNETAKIIESLADTGGFLIKGSELRHWVAHYVNKDRAERLSELPDINEILEIIESSAKGMGPINYWVSKAIAKRIGKEK